MNHFIHKSLAWVSAFGALFLYFLLESMFIISDTPKNIITNIIIALAIILVLLWGYRHELIKNTNSWNFTFNFTKPNKNTVKKIGWAVLALVLILLIQMSIGYLLGGGQTSKNQTELNQIMSQTGIQFKVFIGLIAPIIEEIIFRGLFFNLCFTKQTEKNKYVGIAINGLIFAIFHDPGLSPFVLAYWLMGCILAAIYLKTKDLKYSILVHMANNLIGLL